MGRKRKNFFENVTFDRIGEPVNLEKCPECAEHSDCFACIGGKCTALSESGGQGCVFYRRYAQAIDYLVDEEEKQVNVMAIFNAKRDYMRVMKKYI